MKPWWASKTLWVNLIALVASIGGAYGLNITPEAQASIVTAILAGANIALRFITKDGISIGGKKSGS